MSKYTSCIPVLGLNTGKCRPENTPYLDTFHAKSWIFGMAEYFQLFVYMSDMEPLFDMFSISGINKCLKIFCHPKFVWENKLFIQFLEWQSAIWNNYNHHNTVKFLNSFVRNSILTFISKPCTRKMSEVQLS